MPISSITTTSFFTLVKNSLPSYLYVTDDRIKQLITNAITRVHALYVDNNKEQYNPTVEIDFYNASQNAFINIRDLTRWVGIDPAGFEAVKLLSCNLKEANPDTMELPPGVAYVQDIIITIGNSKDANTEVPEANTGLCCLRDTSGLYNVLTLGATNSWTNLATITALLTYYRPVVLPDWTSETVQYIDIPAKDFPLAINYVQELIMGNGTPFAVRQMIEDKEQTIIYGGKV